MKHKNLFFAKLESSETKPFDGMSAGKFTDMYGRKAVFKPKELADYVAATKKVIESTRTPAGEIVGLPIDSMNHNKGEAAGWIVDVELADKRDVILFTPKWNELGKELISSGRMRMFSPTVDISAKTIDGGSLTNWPASVDNKTNEHLLAPIELSAQLYEFAADESLDAKSSKVRALFYDEFDTAADSFYVLEVFEDYLVCSGDGKLYKVSFTEDAEENLIFETEEDWKQVKRTYTELAKQALEEFSDKLRNVFSGIFDEPEQQSTQEVDEMPFEYEKLSDEDRKVLLDKAAVELSANPSAELSAFIDKQADEKATAIIEAAKREADIAEFSAGLMGGEKDTGLAVDKEKVSAFLSELEPEQLESAKAILTELAGAKMVDFTETGHKKTLTGAQPLPKEYKAILEDHLKTGGTFDEFFSSNVIELGNRNDYNLEGFEEKGAK